MATVEQPAEPRQLVIFRVAETHYALGIEVVDEILPVLPVTPLPGAPGGVLGLADVRKKVVPVFDLHWKFGGQGGGDDDARLILVETSGGHVALLVDAVEEVRTVTSDHVQPVETPGDRSQLTYLNGVVRSGEQLLLWIDHERVVPSGILHTAKLAA